MLPLFYIIIKGKKKMSEKKEFNYKEYQNVFNKQTYKLISLRFRKKEDADLLDFLKTKKSINAYIISLIKEDYKKSQ